MVEGRNNKVLAESCGDVRAKQHHQPNGSLHLSPSCGLTGWEQQLPEATSTHQCSTGPIAVTPDLCIRFDKSAYSGARVHGEQCEGSVHLTHPQMPSVEPCCILSQPTRPTGAGGGLQRSEQLCRWGSLHHIKGLTVGRKVFSH